MLTLIQIQKKLRTLASPAKQKILASFFKCGPGEYGEGDRFLGVTVPKTRGLIPFTAKLSFSEIEILLKSPWHEERLLALLILVKRYRSGNPRDQKKIFDFYLKHRKHVNNWDLVDSSAHLIVGAFLNSKPRGLLFRLAASKSLWDRRIAVIATWFFIRQGDLKTTFELSRKLMDDREDLMHKACGWMLREAGKKNTKALESFLEENAAQMPRTMLRYAIEKFPQERRKKYLAIKLIKQKNGNENLAGR